MFLLYIPKYINRIEHCCSDEYKFDDHFAYYFLRECLQHYVKFKTGPLFITCIFIVVTFILLHILPSVQK